MTQSLLSLLTIQMELWRQEHAADAQPVIYALRMLRWEADTPLCDVRRAAVLQRVSASMALCGACAAVFPQETPDSLLMLLAFLRFPAKAHRNTALWLSGHQLVEACNDVLEQEGEFFVSEEFFQPEDWQAHPPTYNAQDWWDTVSPLTLTAIHQHRTGIQTFIKRRQYAMLGGYVTRALRTDPEPGLTCFGLVPVIIEAIWSQHANVSLQQLIDPLPLVDMARKPKESLLAWLDQISIILRQLPASPKDAPIERVIAAIEADCSLPYSQQNLSRSLGLTPAYFCRLFREKTGQHFSTFLTRTRMERAKALLLSGDLPLQALAERCGYPNKSYFCQVFKRHTGMTPGEYEQQLRAPHG